MPRRRLKFKAAGQLREDAELLYKQAENDAVAEIETSFEQYLKTKKSLDYYRNSGLPNAELISKQSVLAFQKGSISYAEHIINLQQSDEIKQNYLSTLLEYNKSIITLEFLSGLTK